MMYAKYRSWVQNGPRTLLSSQPCAWQLPRWPPFGEPWGSTLKIPNGGGNPLTIHGKILISEENPLGNPDFCFFFVDMIDVWEF